MPATRPRTPRPHRRMPAAPLAASLDQLALVVERAHGEAEGWDGANLLVRAWSADADAGAVELGFVAVDGDVGDALVGTRAPDTCDVVGVAALGWVRPLDERGAPGPRGERVRTVHLLHRDGTAASVLHRRGGTPEAVPGPAEGRLPDLLRRALGLRTPAPSTTPTELLSLAWLGALLDADPATIATWDGVASLHPVVAMLPVRHRRPGVDELARLARAAGDALRWERIRRSCARGDHGGGVGAALAAWHDEGSFARHVLGQHPPPAVLGDAVAQVLPASLAARVRVVLAASGVEGGELEGGELEGGEVEGREVPGG